MKGINTYFRALTDYRKNTDSKSECVKMRTSVAEVGKEFDKIKIVREKCTIDVEWVEEIEKGLVFVEKALKEERQFIRTNGEVVLIEKVKHVSRGSAEHLARHSELITRLSDDGDITPDKIYTEERLNDYAVYENRFLYMMLCYLKDFISLRYSLILKAVNLYDGSAELIKTVHSPKGEMNFKMTLSETINDDDYLAEHNGAKDILDRIDLILKMVTSFLSYPLMQEVAKTPMLKPPITKTNVLRMNHNFKNALSLYEYVSDYNGDGFTLTTEIKEINGFKGSSAEDFAELVRLASFLTYEYGLDIREDLKQKYEQEEKQRKAEEQRKFVEQIELLRKRVRESGMGLEEYMLMLEKRNKTLQAENDYLDEVLKKNEMLEKVVAERDQIIASLNEQIEALNNEIIELNAKHEQEIAELKASYEKEIERINSEHEQAIIALKKEYEERIAALTKSYEEKIEEINNIHKNEIETLTAAHNEQIENLNKEHKQKIDELTQSYEDNIKKLEEDYTLKLSNANQAKLELDSKVDALSKEISDKQSDIDSLTEENLMYRAKINALKQKYNAFDGNENFVSEENFNDIEEQYKLFKKFFNKTWKDAKKSIRANVKSELNEKNVKNSNVENKKDSTNSKN